MKRACWLLLFPLAAHAAEHDHSAQPEGLVTPESSAYTDGLVTPEPSAQAEARHMNMMHGDSLNFLVLGESVERTGDDSLQWDIQGWLGYDRDRLWFKTEGEHATDANADDHSEAQLLYGRAVSPYWDLQAGLRRDDAGSASRTYAVFGVQGLAPYWFELDAAAFLSEKGDLSARFEAEYELHFTQKLLLQPRLELNYSFADDPALGIGDGMSKMSFGLRLRYELRREIAPYVGVEWWRAFGGTAALLRAVGEDQEESRIVAGVRFWY